MASGTDARASSSAGRPPGGVLDWGLGHYERTAAALAPAAEAVVATASVRREDRVVDVGCGTGSAALIAARAGAKVTGVDPAPRLLDVARGLAEREALDVEFVRGDAASLPLPDASVDIVLSNFGVIFAPDPSAAAGEMVRVLAPGGRIVFSAWLPGSLVGEMNAAAMRMVQGVVGAPIQPAPFAWHDETALGELFNHHDMRWRTAQHELSFTAASPAEYLEAERRSHPLAVAGFGILERAGQADEAQRQLLRMLEEGNEDATAFRTTSRYVVVSATRH